MTDKEAFQVLNQIAFYEDVGGLPYSWNWTSTSRRFKFGYNYRALVPDEHTENKKWVAYMSKRVGKHWNRIKIRYFNSRKAAEKQAWSWTHSANMATSKRRAKTLRQVPA